MTNHFNKLNHLTQGHNIGISTSSQKYILSSHDISFNYDYVLVFKSLKRNSQDLPASKLSTHIMESACLKSIMLNIKCNNCEV